MRYLPVFMDLRGRRALVVGRGEVARRKAEPLASAGAEIVVRERFDPADLVDCALAVGADADEIDIRALVAAARARGIPLNVVDRPALCSVIMPAIIDRDPLTIAVSSAGVAPVLARLVRARIEAAVPAAFGRLASFAEGFAEDIRRRLPDTPVRRRALERIFSGPAAEFVFAGDDRSACEAVETEIAAAEAGRDLVRGIVFLVGAGPGNAELVTLRAHRLLGEADVVAYGTGVAAGVLELARRDAVRVDLDAIAVAAETQVIRLAQAGHRVVWLLPGAGAPPSAALAASGVACTTVPGVAATA